MLGAILALFAAPALAATTDCATYCSLIATTCNMTNAQFAAGGISPAVGALLCQTVCPVYPTTGTVGDASGDTFQCRAYHLDVATTASMNGDAAGVATHCPHAGFYGGGVCGTPADFQCDFMMNSTVGCGTTGTHTDCVNSYNMYAQTLSNPSDPTFSASLFKTTGNTLQCRTAQAFSHLQATPNACTDAMAVSNACGQTNCTDFCTFEGSVCGWGSTGNAQYTTAAACMSACNTWNMAPLNMSQVAGTGDTSACRMYHLNVAAQSAALATAHCPHTANWPMTTPQYCEASCAYYCSTIQAACTGSNMVFADTTSCMAACAMYPVKAAPYTRPIVKGNTLQCRIYHASAAYDSWGLATVHCPHASPNSTADWCQDTGAASSLKVGAATAFLVLVGAVSSMLGL